MKKRRAFESSALETFRFWVEGGSESHALTIIGEDFAETAAKLPKQVAVGVSPWKMEHITGPAAKRRQHARSVHVVGTYTKLTYHVVFSTKYRRRIIAEPFRERVYEYIGGIVRNLNGSVIEIGGIEDHIHMLVNLSPAKSVSDAIRDIKANSSKWLNDLPEVKRRFEWQKGYGAFTVSHSQIDSVREYIQNQKEHHRKMTFEEEYIKMLERHGIEFERKYLFEDEHNG